MIGTLFLTLLSCTAAWGSDGGTNWICEAYLPSSTFQMHDLEMVEEVVVEDHRKLDLELGKMEVYETEILVYTAKMVNLTGEIEKMEKDPEAFNEAYIESIKIQIKQVEALMVEVQSSFLGSSAVFMSIRETATYSKSTLTQLEVKYDRNRVLESRRKLMNIQLQLKECERQQEEIVKPEIGSCSHTGVVKVSQPTASQINTLLNVGYKFGAWGKDSKPLPDRESMYWFYASQTAATHDIRFYSTYKDLILRNHFQHHRLHSSWHGKGNNVLMRENVLYYQRANPFSMARLNFTSMNYEYRVIPKASPSFSYAHSPNQNIDFAADETGLWLTYASVESEGRLVLAKINEPSFAIEDIWPTSVFKPGVSNAFMVCGVLYLLRSIDTNTEEIFYMFDTKAQQEHYVSVPFERFQENYVNLDYNPTDQKLYMYNNGYFVNHRLTFNYTTT